jgi:hypothetical protein
MIWLILALLFAALVGVIVAKEWHRPAPAPSDPEAALRAAVALHAIRRRIDVEVLKREQRQRATQTRREIAEALDEDAS